MARNGTINRVDILGLAVGDGCGCDPDGNELVIVADDAGEECCEHLIETISLHTRPTNLNPFNFDSGHAAVETPNMCQGHWPADDVGGGNFFTNNTVPGETINELPPQYGGDFEDTQSYRACPDTVSSVEQEMENLQDAPYNLGNNGVGFNCTGWAATVLVNGGLPNPLPNSNQWPGSQDYLTVPNY
jgi:hypothetical protein